MRYQQQSMNQIIPIQSLDELEVASELEEITKDKSYWTPIDERDDEETAR